MPSRSSLDMFAPQLALQSIRDTEPQPSPSSPELSLRKQEQTLRRQLRRSLRIGDLVQQAACYLSLGDIERLRGDSERAGELYRQALKLSQTAHSARQAIARSSVQSK